MKAIQKTSMEKYFESIILGFSDTLPVIKTATGIKGRGQNKLANLAQHFEIEASHAHDAVYDVYMLEQILLKLNIPQEHKIFFQLE